MSDDYEGDDLRCPKCGSIDYSADPHDYRGMDDGDEQDWTCPECGHDYTFGARTQTVLISPRMEGMDDQWRRENQAATVTDEEALAIAEEMREAFPGDDCSAVEY